jgi:polar amino acid transport system substrate-binding protein
LRWFDHKDEGGKCALFIWFFRFDLSRLTSDTLFSEILIKRKEKMFLRLWCLGFCLLTLVGCGEKEKHPEGPKPLVVIISPDNPPFEFKDTAQEGDKVIGFDVDVIEELGKRLGRPIKIVEADFPSLIPAVQTGRADMAISAIAATDERRKSVDFSDPYYTYKFALLVPEDSKITSEKDLNDKTIGVQMGSSHEIQAKKWKETMSGLSLISLNNFVALAQEVKNGRIQAALTEETTAHKIAASTPGLKVVVVEDAQGESPAIVFPKGSPWVQPTNEALKAMKGDIEQLEKKWFKQ